MSCQELLSHFPGLDGHDFEQNTRSRVAWNNEACLMRYCIEYKSKLAQLENLSAFLDGRHPSSLFCQFLTSPGNKTFAVSIWFTAILWDLCT